MNYFWVRIFDYRKYEEENFHKENGGWGKFKGTLQTDCWLNGIGGKLDGR